MSNVNSDATQDEILDGIREIRSQMTRNRSIEGAEELGAALADLVAELDERLSSGGPLPTAWQKR